MRRILRVTHLPALLSMMVVAVVWVFAEWQNRNMHEQVLREEVLSSASVVRAHIEGTLTSNVQLVRGLIATLITEPDMDLARFTLLAAGLMNEDSLLRNLAIAPDMVIRYVYPLEGNIAAVGLNYLENPSQREAAIQARDTGRLVIAGPVDMVQGGIGFIGRFPVFIADGTATGRFWGLVSAVIDADRFYTATGLNDETLRIQVALSGETGPVFFGDPAILEENPVEMPITLPFGNWQMAAIPTGGWQSRPPNVWGLRLMLLAGAALLVVPGLIMGRLLDERARNVERLRETLKRQGEANSRFQSVSRISRTFVWEQDAGGHLTYLSSGFQHVTGLSRQALLGQTLQDLARHDRPGPLQAPDLTARLEAGQPFNDVIIEAATRDGDEIWLQLSGSPVLDDAGQVRGYRGAGMDITGIQQARQAADEASRVKSLFLATMSHEIRTPLNGVLGMAQVLESVMNDPEKRLMVRTIRESGETLQNILNDILDLSKIEADKLELENRPFQPEATLQRIIDLHRMGIEEKGLTLAVSGLEAPGPARQGDSHRFAQILHNLIGNAVKFTEGGQVSVQMTNLPGAALQIRVTDTGPGMSNENLRRLFEPFVQGDGSVARRYGGAGLGMSIVKRLLGLMQGSIEVRSAPGEGTCVSVSLPLAAVRLQTETPAAAAETRTLAGLRLLAADDNRTNRLVLEAMLRGTGIALTLVEDGQQAVEAWRGGDFDVLLFDISMPVVGGIEALTQITQEAAEQARPRPPAIAFTANVMAHQVSDYLGAGFDSCVGKPLNRGLLMAALTLAARRQDEAPPAPATMR